MIPPLSLESFEECAPLDTYHKGTGIAGYRERNRDKCREQREEGKRNRRMIAWDGEGMNLSGDNKPQHYVMFGCSAEPHRVRKIVDPKGDLTFPTLAGYICDVAERYPDAFHVGFGFRYDQNMIIKSLPWRVKEAIHKGNRHGVKIKCGPYGNFRVWVRWGKMIQITRERRGRKTTVKIEDIHAFFASSFVAAYEKLFRGDLDDNWQTVVEGKQMRGLNRFEHLDDVEKYWRAEIIAMERLAERFKEIVYDAGFYLGEWYGPGALANLVRKMHMLEPHEWGGKEQNIPSGVHAAAKSAFYGGRFEQFSLGRIDGPVYGLDINSAYPYAFSRIPSLRQGGFWQEVEKPSDNPDTFGVYHVVYNGASSPKFGYPRKVAEAQPLPFRNAHGEVRYQTVCEGWYWRPEMDMARDLFPESVQVLSGWEWRPATDERPWSWITDMFDQRLALKAQGNPVEMAYKLAMNSLYGKMAQRIGWNKELRTPPRAHTLAIAGYVTSTCRAMIMRVAAQIPTEQLIAIETDGIYVTTNPETLTLPTGMGKGLGQWGVDRYDECIYIQNGVYLLRSGEDWIKAKSRGMPVKYITEPAMATYLASLTATFKPCDVWQPYNVPVVGTRFVTLGGAIGRSRNGKGQLIPQKASALHCRWIPDPKAIVAGGTGKRNHFRKMCPACLAGLDANSGRHQLVTALDKVPLNSTECYNPVSKPYVLPWEDSGEDDAAWRSNDTEPPIMAEP